MFVFGMYNKDYHLNNFFKLHCDCIINTKVISVYYSSAQTVKTFFIGYLQVEPRQSEPPLLVIIIFVSTSIIITIGFVFVIVSARDEHWH